MIETRATLTELEHHDAFAARHIGPGGTDLGDMLHAVGAADLDELVGQTVPEAIRLADPLSLPAPLTEVEVIARLRETASRNTVMTSLIGLGYHDTITPPVIQRNILEDPAWYTAYTPYQPEISQGRLEALLNFQTLVADLTGLPLANASLLDEGTAAAEAMTMAKRVSKATSPVFFVDADCHPQTIAVVATRAEPIGIEVVVGDPLTELPAEMFGALVAYPGSSGELRDLAPVAERVHAAGGLVVVVADPLAMVMTTPPAELGADIAVGSMQRFGVPMGYGGPHAGFIATSDDHANNGTRRRDMPGGRSAMTVVPMQTQARPRATITSRKASVNRRTPSVSSPSAPPSMA